MVEFGRMLMIKPLLMRIRLNFCSWTYPETNKGMLWSFNLSIKSSSLNDIDIQQESHAFVGNAEMSRHHHFFIISIIVSLPSREGDNKSFMPKERNYSGLAIVSVELKGKVLSSVILTAWHETFNWKVFRKEVLQSYWLSWSRKLLIFFSDCWKFLAFFLAFLLWDLPFLLYSRYEWDYFLGKFCLRFFQRITKVHPSSTSSTYFSSSLE